MSKPEGIEPDRIEADGADLERLIDRLPEGWTEGVFEGRRYGIVRRNHVDGRTVTLRADELGGTDLISANVYRTAAGDVLKPCEMPAEKVLDFLRGWTDDGSDQIPEHRGSRAVED